MINVNSNKNFVENDTSGTLKERIFKFIEKYNFGVTFAELEHHFGEEIKGTKYIASALNHNVIFWVDLSHEFIEAYRELFYEKKIEIKNFGVATYLCYVYDQKTLNMPLVQGARNYKTPHWMPVEINTTIIGEN